MALHPFQSESVAWCVEKSDARRVLVAPTGTGKSHIISATAAAALAQGDRVTVCVHRLELLEQTAERFREYGMHFGYVASGVKPAPYEKLTLAMIQTLRRRMDTVTDGTVIIDECHRNEFSVVHKSRPRRLIGFTATPKPAQGPMGQWFDDIKVGISYSEAIRLGYIVPERIWAPDVPNLGDVKVRGGEYDETALAEKIMRMGLVGAVVKNWLVNGNNEKTIVFAVNKLHAEALTSEFCANGAAFGCITSDTPHGERKVLMARFRAGSLCGLVNVACFVEGLNVADASLLILADATHSLTRYMQKAGRAARAAPGKAFYRIFDHGGNVFEHGSPSQDRAWSLHDGETVKRGERPIGLRYCKKCYFVFSPSSSECPNCSTPHTTAPVTSKDGELVEVLPEKYQPIAGYISAYETARRKAFAVHGRNPHAVREAMQATRAILRGGKQVIVPQDPNLLW